MARTASQITLDAIQTLLSATGEVSNMNMGSLARSLLEALGAEGALLDQEITDLGFQSVLNAAFQIFGVSPLPAQGSVYALQFSNSTGSPVTVPQGTAVTVQGGSLTWTTVSSLVVPASGNAIVNAACSTTGSQTNVPAATITVLTTPIAGISVTNPSAQAVLPGTDAETPLQTQARLSNIVASIHRGDAKSIETGVLAGTVLTDSSGNVTEEAVKALCLDLPTAGEAVLYLYNGQGPASSALVSLAQEVVDGYTDASGVVHDGYKAAGVVVTVYDATETPVDVSAQILPQPGQTFSSVASQATASVDSDFAALDIGEGLSVAGLALAIMQTPGVADVVVTAPAGNLTGSPLVQPSTNAPSLTATSPSPATSLAAGTYDVSFTYTNEWGETTPSPAASIALTAGQAIQVASLTPLANGARGVNYYLSTAAGSATVALDASGNGSQTTLSSLPPSGAAEPPSANTAAIKGNIYVPGSVSLSQMTS